MTKEDIGIFTRRISQGNRSDIIVVVYDIYFAYEEDALAAIKKSDMDAFAFAIRHMSDAVSHLMSALDFTYEISSQLYPLYDYTQRCLSRALYAKDINSIESASKVMSGLREAFIEVARADESGRSMRNAETVTAGYTYGPGSLNEISVGGSNRGFYA